MKMILRSTAPPSPSLCGAYSAPLRISCELTSAAFRGAIPVAHAAPLCLAQKLVQPLVFVLALRYTGIALLCG